MSEDNAYKYLGLAVAGILTIYIGVKSLSFQVKLIEGMSNPITNTTASKSNEFVLIENMANTSAENVKKQNDKLNDIISFDKYRKDYENLIIALEEYSNIMIFSKVVSIGKQVSDNGIGKDITTSIINDMNVANSMKNFVDTLNSTMKYVDKKKSTTFF